VYFHDDRAVQRLFEVPFQEFPHLPLASKCILYDGAMKIDLWRLLILYAYGGLYTDIDTVPGVELTKWNSKNNVVRDDDDGDGMSTTATAAAAAKPPPFHYLSNIPYPQNISFVSGSDGRNRPTQWLFGMSPKHPIGFYTLQVILRNILAIRNIQKLKLVVVTGPEALREGYEYYVNNTIAGDQSTSNRRGTKRRQRKQQSHSPSNFQDLMEDPLSPGLFHPLGVQKLSSKDTAEWFGVGNLGGRGDELVRYKNATVTRKDRIAEITGTEHWSKLLYRQSFQKYKYEKQQRHNLPKQDMSCMEYLLHLSSSYYTNNIIVGD
jgi:hypothetical protein